MAQLVFQPFQYNPVSGQLLYFSSIRVRLDFNQLLSSAITPSDIVQEGSFEIILQNSLLNYSQALKWRTPSNTINVSKLNQSADGEQHGIKLLVKQAGIYEITYSDLLTAGVEKAILDAINPSTIKLFNQGMEVAIFVNGEQDGYFDPGDNILFYGDVPDTVYTNTNVYWLEWDGASGVRMPALSGNPGGSAFVPQSFQNTTRVEQDKIYLSSMPI